MAQKIIETDWFVSEKLLVTRLAGDIDLEDLIKWEIGLHEGFNKIRDHDVFKIFVNLYGFKAENFHVHKRFRTIIPSNLANYGWKVGYADLFPEESNMLTLTNLREIQCIACAHCHDDENKIGLYEKHFSKDNERFFTNMDEAGSWIRSLPTRNSSLTI